MGSKRDPQESPLSGALASHLLCLPPSALQEEASPYAKYPILLAIHNFPQNQVPTEPLSLAQAPEPHSAGSRETPQPPFAGSGLQLSAPSLPWG